MADDENEDKKGLSVIMIVAIVVAFVIIMVIVGGIVYYIWSKKHSQLTAYRADEPSIKPADLYTLPDESVAGRGERVEPFVVSETPESVADRNQKAFASRFTDNPEPYLVSET